jgi:hypothetical protein
MSCVCLFCFWWSENRNLICLELCLICFWLIPHHLENELRAQKDLNQQDTKGPKKESTDLVNPHPSGFNNTYFLLGVGQKTIHVPWLKEKKKTCEDIDNSFCHPIHFLPHPKKIII